ncbi:MAG: hypothetical protein ACI38Z_04120 [Parafannyhessea sp.]|uniref:hypothetical protein n=1 Tax=Parafannyhessea sp. TaxID=2847324 RepID=UPI003EFE19AE
MSEDSKSEGMAQAERERRLERYEAFAASVREDYGTTQRQMDDLRAQDRVKTATYRQLYAYKCTLGEILDRLEECGL